MREFEIHEPDHIVFGDGAESRTAALLAEHRAARVLLIAVDRHRDGADRIAAALGERAVGVFTTSVPQVPRAVADAAIAMARESKADWVVAHGGGTAIGVAKAVALECDVRVAAVPTTYAGSERTNIYGITDGGEKVTGRDDRVRPRLVVYDPTLTHGLPRVLSLQSLLNALAHSVEALYAVDFTPEARDAAERSLAPLLAGLQGLGADLSSAQARNEALYGAWLASEALAGASLALHHKLAHVLGGSFGTPHAPTHATLLPHTMGFNLAAAPAARAVLERAWGTDDPAAHLYDVMRELELSVTLRDLGLGLDDLPRIAELATRRQYPSPRPFDAPALQALLFDAWHARRPTRSHGRLRLDHAGVHGGLEAATAGPALDRTKAVVIALHGRGAEPDRFLADLRRRAGDAASDVAWIAPLAARNSWYPKGILSPVDENQPHLDDALATVSAAWELARRHVPAERIVLAGFSQGACLILTWLLRGDARPGHVLIFSGAPSPVDGDYANLADVPVHLGISSDDRWVPREPWLAARDALVAAGARVSAIAQPGLGHGIHPFDGDALRGALEAL